MSLVGAFPPALSVDVEEWFHNCWVPEWNDPALRPPYRTELDELLPRLADELALHGARATFFVLGEVAERLAPRLRALHAAGHEIACHALHHFRANDLPVAEFARQIATAKALLEDSIGAPVAGFRSPEWSLRDSANPRLRVVADSGFRYDSSLIRALGAGCGANPETACRFRWPDGVELFELPPLTWAGALRLPASGWCGRAAAPRWILQTVRAAARKGRSAMLVVHPWELVDRPCPGPFTGLARFLHDASRIGYLEKFRILLGGVRWTTLQDSLVSAGAMPRAASAGSSLVTVVEPMASLVGGGAR